MNNQSQNKFSETSQILMFWRDLEIFNIPKAPTEKDKRFNQVITTLRTGQALPWNNKDFLLKDDKYTYNHKVFIGVADQEHITKLVLHQIVNQSLSVKDRERIKGTGWLASFNLNENGFLKEDSYTPASFVWGTEVLSQGKSLNDLNSRLERAKSEFAMRCQSLTQAVRCDWNTLETEANLVKSILDPDLKEFMDWRYVVVTQKVRRIKDNDDNEQDATYLNSFYLDDLDKIVNQSQRGQAFGAALSAYLGQPIPENNRIDILENHQTMQTLVSAANLPIARWLSAPDKPLVLAQQAVVAHIGQKLQNQNGVIGVNGPPGTGKTTLLCDVIANVITDRAKRLASLSAPHEIFNDSILIAGKKFFPIKAGIVRDSSIVVSSNNNNAVKNISQELPALNKIHEKYVDDALYFNEVIEGVFDNQNVKNENNERLPTWGLIAAALGNSSNKSSFANAFFKEFVEDKDEKENSPPVFLSMKQVLENSINQFSEIRKNWHIEKKEFIELLNEFEQNRSILKDAEQAEELRSECIDQINGLSHSILQYEQKLQAENRNLELIQTSLKEQEVLINSKQQVLMLMQRNNDLNILDKILAVFGVVTHRMQQFRYKITEETESLQMFSQKFESEIKAKNQKENDIQKIKLEISESKQQLAKFEKQHFQIEERLKSAEALGVKTIVGRSFWQQSFEDQHRTSINTSEVIDDLRARIFVKALKLHELTILANAKCFLSNLRLVAKMLSGGAKGLLYEERPLVWDSLFFVVPVVSTTLASFSRLFTGLGQDSIGWLLIDEAGQATPQSAVGAIWRSKRAILIGDPLQVEPVFTLPDSIVDVLRQENKVDKAWSPVFESVQTLADRITSLGSWISRDSSGQSKIWTGMPLRTHRRCDDPMFSVSNEIAYAGQMVQGRVNEFGSANPLELPYDIGESTWYHVDSKKYSHPVNEDELDVLISLLNELENQRTLVACNTKLKIYVISPFRKVFQACKDSLRKAKIDNVECGTIHTFQGKEADIVFLVLGTSKEQDGLGARMWASSNPNLLNVAVTRAKARLYVIGNAGSWSGLNYFSILHNSLVQKNNEN